MGTLLTIPGFLGAVECEALIARAERGGFAPAPITTPSGFRMAPEIRNNSRFMVDDAALAMDLWKRLEPTLTALVPPAALGLNERFRFYRYGPGEAFHWHRDGRFVRNEREASRLTFMVYLNEAFLGGNTAFRAPDESIAPRTGLGVVFDHGLLHQGAPVRSGTKYVLRSDVMYARFGS